MNKKRPQEEARHPEEYFELNLDTNNKKRPHVYITLKKLTPLIQSGTKPVEGGREGVQAGRGTNILPPNDYP